jgi:hypothetical protein
MIICKEDPPLGKNSVTQAYWRLTKKAMTEIRDCKIDDLSAKDRQRLLDRGVVHHHEDTVEHANNLFFVNRPAQIIDVRTRRTVCMPNEEFNAQLQG